MRQLLFLEMNELIFPYLEKYIMGGRLPTLKRLFEEYSYVETSSEENFEGQEPWIQWVSVHTGKYFAEHGVFRLGDMVGQEHAQIWEHLEQRGIRVGAISPMNAENRLKTSCFFMPDPWTETAGSGSFLFLQLYKAIKQAVNDNARKRVTLQSAFYLILGWLWYSRISSFPIYAWAIFNALHGREWARAIFLDRFLGDLFINLCNRKHPQFASLFLNAAAHIQHHYLYSSLVYEGECKNPPWYISSGLDPVYEIYRVYDQVISNVLQMPSAPRIMIATGLQQEPHGKATFFYRFKEHKDFFRSVGIEFTKINTLMSRDFVIEFDSIGKSLQAERVLREATDMNGVKLFTVSSRELSLFIELIYATEINPGLSVKIGDYTIDDFYRHVAFVAIRNGQHNGIGYFLDTGRRAVEREKRVPIVDLWDRINDAVAG